MQFAAVRRAERYVGLAMIAGLSGVAGAQTTQTGMTVSTGASVESNPYSQTNAGKAGVAATLDLQPRVVVRSERSTFDLRGLAQFRQFLSRYGLEDNYGLSGDISSQVAERITLRTNAAFSYNQGGFGYGRPASSPDVPATFEPGTTLPDPLTGLTDVLLLGGRNRVTSINGGVGADAKLSAYSGLSLDLTGRAMRFKQAGFGDYNTIGAELRWNYELSEFTSLGLVGNVSRSDYLDTRVGDSRTYSILGSVDRRLGKEWSLSASGGLSFTTIDQLLGQPDTKFSSFTTQLRFCRNTEFSRFCLNGNRSPEPSANGSVRVSTALEANYWQRLTERDSISLSGSFSRTGAGRGPAIIAQPAAKYTSASARFDRTLNQRMTGFVSTSFSKIFFPTSPRKANFGVNAGVQFRFGALQ